MFYPRRSPAGILIIDAAAVQLLLGGSKIQFKCHGKFLLAIIINSQ